MNTVNDPKEAIVEDRRRYFRIEDQVNLFYKVVDEQKMLSATQQSSDMLAGCSLISALDSLDQEAKQIMIRIEKHQPDIAEYLKIVDTKIGLIANEMMRNDQDLTESNLCKTNISASGIAFETKESLSEGQFLQLKLLLTSCFAVIVLYGKVIYCKQNPDAEADMPFLVGIDFVNINQQDREILVKHVVKRQMQQLREQKERQTA